MHKIFLFLGAFFGGLGVIIGAFGAHGLKDLLVKNEALSSFETGVQYHFYHAFALLAAGILQQYGESTVLSYAGYAWTAGIIIFSGSLYTLGITGHRWLGAITPVGGLLLIAGWVLLCMHVLRNVS